MGLCSFFSRQWFLTIVDAVLMVLKLLSTADIIQICSSRFRTNCSSGLRVLFFCWTHLFKNLHGQHSAWFSYKCHSHNTQTYLTKIIVKHWFTMTSIQSSVLSLQLLCTSQTLPYWSRTCGGRRGGQGDCFVQPRKEKAKGRPAPAAA